MDNSQKRRLSYLEKIHREMVRDIIRQPTDRIIQSLMNPETRDAILAERAEWLKTPRGLRMLAIAAELESLLEE